MQQLLTTTHLTAIGYNNDQGTTLTLPVGRIVWGHPTKPRPATDNRNQPKLGKDGQQLMETSFGLAIPVAEFQAGVWPVMAAEAAKGYPNGAPGNFSWKMTQPHEIDNAGKPYSDRQGYAGHIVLAVSTVLEPPAAFKWNGSQWQQMGPDEIRCGDYVQVEINFKVNVPADRTHTPSMYVNPRAIGFVGYGEPIQTGYQANPTAAFGNGPPPLPAGASATPVGGAPAVGMPGATAAPAQTAGMPGAPGNATAGMPTGPAVPAAMTPPPVAPSSPQRPADPSHIHDNGNGTEQWFVNGAWDGGAHPAAVAAQPATLPPPATGFVAQAAGMPGAPAAAGMPGMPAPR